jgi:Uma2 family endonuclease
MAIEARRRAWSTEEYHRMADVGLLGEDDRVELIEVEVVEMSPVGARHAHASRVLIHRLSRLSADRYIVDAGDPIAVSASSEPQPDVMLLRWRDDQ